MADPKWLQQEVCRELDEADATYFALTLHSTASRQCLVSTLFRVGSHNITPCFRNSTNNWSQTTNV